MLLILIQYKKKTSCGKSFLRARIAIYEMPRPLRELSTSAALVSLTSAQLLNGKIIHNTWNTRTIGAAV